MKTYIDHILQSAQQQQRLMLAAEALCEARTGRTLRLCLSTLLLLVLMAFPAECGALLP